MSSDHFLAGFGHEVEAERSEPSRKKKHQPKGILKNSNPNATYHKHHHRRRLEELIENERPDIIPTSHHHGRHRHHHDHHKHHRHADDEELAHNNEKNIKMSKKHHHNGGSKEKKHKHHRHHHSSSSGDNASDSSEFSSKIKAAVIDQHPEHVDVEYEEDDMSNIYDRPKVPPIPFVISNSRKPDNSTCGGDRGEEEAPQQQVQVEEAVYDVPRSNPRKVEQPQPPQQKEEAIYVNNSFAVHGDVKYDVPRSAALDEVLDQFVPLEYDVPKIRDSLSTIEEEHQEYYDVPRNIQTTLEPFEEDDDPIVSSEENLYENQGYHEEFNNSKSGNAISEFSVTSTHTDDSRSSGYRSSSSPSIQSEELYVNELNMDQRNSFEEFIPPPPAPPTPPAPPPPSSHHSHVKEIGVGTSGSLPKQERKKAKKDKEAKRERERAEAEAVEIEILHKKQQQQLSLERPKKSYKAPKPPKTYFTENASNSVDLPVVSTEERKKSLLKSIDAKKEVTTKRVVNEEKLEPKVAEKSNNGTMDKKPSQRDRSVDVYHETVRQRATRTSEPAKDVFPSDQNDVTKAKKKRAPQHPQKDIKDEDLPSVKELRSRFEAEKANKAIFIEASKATKKKIDFKKGFNVMSSLTRRSAMSLSKSMQNLSSTDQHHQPSIGKDKNDLGFSQFTYAESEQDLTKRTQLEIVDDDPLYVNLNSRETEVSTKKEETNVLPQQANNSSNSSSNRSRPGAESSTANKKLMSALEGEVEEDQGQSPGLGPWNPIKTLAHLYKLQEIRPGDGSSQLADGAMEGFLERLPPGKKKSTIWNSWKRQYFVAKAGLLLIFGDSSRSVLMDRIELFGGRVDYMESTMLGVQDRRGHYVVLRCKDSEEADCWHSGLSAHVSHDLAQTFVTPILSNPDLFKQILVVDFGGSSVRAGIACSMPTLPQLFFPSVMAIAKGHEDEKYFGMDAFAPEIRSRCNLVHPFAPSSNIDKYSVNQIALQGFLEKIFRDLNIDPSDYEIQLVSPRPLNEKTQRNLASLLFDDFGVRAVNIAHQSVMAMYAYNAHTGVVVDLGERMDVVPIVDGYRVSAGVSRSPVGGPQLRQKLQHYLLGRNYSLTTFVDSFVVRTAIESLAYMSRNFDRELERYRKKPEKIDCTLELGKSTKLEIGSERFEAAEGLFKPELWGLDQAGVHVLVHKAIRECSMDVRREVTQSIFLAGGLSLIPGLRERIELELEKLSPATKPRVHSSPYRYHASFVGATAHATSTAFKQTKLTRDEWNGAGQRLPQPWNLS